MMRHRSVMSKQKNNNIKKTDHLLEKEDKRPLSNFIIRAVLTMMMIGMFIYVNYCDKIYLIIFVIFLTVCVLREIISISKTPKGYSIPIYIIYGFTSIVYLYYLSDALSSLYPSLANFFILFKRRYFYIYISLLIIFVCSLKPGMLRQQFALFSLIHLSSYVVANSCRAALRNLQIGKFWLFFPSTLVICNDIFAYITGKLLGHTPLFKLSPKKTFG